jgi:hypothetical protein
MPPSPKPSATKFAIELDGVRVGVASWVEGGEPVGTVVETALGPNVARKKHVTTIRWTPIKISIGMGMGSPLFDWIKAFIARMDTKKNGAIIVFDAAGRPRSRMEWLNGAITELCFPAPDATDRSEGQLVITIQPARTILRDAAQEARLAAPPKTKAWLLSNFRIAIDNITGDTRRVSRIESIVVRRSITEYRDGGSRDVTIILGPQHVSDVILTLPDGQAKEFARWADDFLVQGHSSDADERNGAIDFLDPGMRPLFTLSLKHLGIFRLARERVATAKNVTAKAKAYLYCEELLFDRAPGITPAPERQAGRAAAKKALTKKVAKRPARRPPARNLNRPPRR